jgi:phosphate transport system substrate-binding protein
MRFSRIVLVIYLFLFALVASLPPATWGQVRPTLDPGVFSYTYQESASGKLAVSAPETMKPLLRAWAEGLALRHPGLKIDVLSEGSGSDTGLSALLEHRTDIAAMPRRITAAEISEFVREYGYEPTEIPVAHDAVGIFVHKDNPITGLSLDQLDAMFCSDRRRGVLYQIDSWGLVGAMDEWFDAPVRIYGRNGKSATAHFFREEVCKGGALHPNLIDGQGLASVVLDVGDDQEGIGFSAVGYETSLVKPVPIASVKGGRYVAPSVQTAMDGSYPLKRNLYFYVAKAPKTSPAQASVELIRFALSQQGQNVALDLGYFPLSLPEHARAASKWSPSVKAAQTEKPNPIESPSGS